MSKLIDKTQLAMYLPNIDNAYAYSGNLDTRVYDTRDDCNFEIIKFPHLRSNIPTSSAYGEYVSHLKRYSTACSCYSDFVK